MADDMEFSAAAVAAPVRWWHRDARLCRYSRPGATRANYRVASSPGSPAQDYLHHRNIDDVLAHGSA